LVETSSLPDGVHVHADQEEGFHVIEGELIVELDGERGEVPARSFVIVPRGVTRRHLARRSSRYLVVFSPATLGH
jgi:quercetin dioxygenase-like cupin family protein